MQHPAKAAPHPPADLSAALIEAGIELLTEGGMAALTLRRVAARVGVSHAAPAHHFAGLPGLLTAIATRAFTLFADSMQARADAVTDGGAAGDFARLCAVSQGYLDFAARHGGLFQLMFATPGLDRCDAALHAASMRSYGLLRAAAHPFADPTHPEELELAIWSMVHGYAALIPALAATPDPDAPLLWPEFDRMLARMVRYPPG